ASAVIALQVKVLAYLKSGGRGTAEQIAVAIGEGAKVETVFHILRRLAANPDRKVIMAAGSDEAHVTESVFSLEA
ncbi:MAG: hypothetical protein ACP5O7_13380, partial [Phycisphaerae bacterium]